MSKYYAVANGRKTGIFESWDEVKPLVNGFPSAKYKSFQTYREAEAYINDFEKPKNQHTIQPTTENSKQGSSPPLTSPLSADQISQTYQTEDHRIVAYTDGSCIDKIGGLGYLVIYKNVVTPISAKVPIFPCTNQIAELYAIYAVIYFLITSYQEDFVQNGLVIYTDSKYSIGCLTEWCYNWNKNGWINSKGETVANKELIQAILQLSRGLKIEYRHVRGHKGDYYNEWADRLANAGRLQ